MTSTQQAGICPMAPTEGSCILATLSVAKSDNIVESIGIWEGFLD